MTGNPYKQCCRRCKTGRGDCCNAALSCVCHHPEAAAHQRSDTDPA